MNAKEITEIIAREKNMTPEAVEYEMRSAIREAMVSEKPDAKAMWKQIAPDGKEPSINRFLQFCVNILNERKEK